MANKRWLDPKTRNLILFFGLRLPVLLSVIYYSWIKFGDNDPVRFFGQFCIFIIIWRSALSIYRRMILPAKHPKSYGKWCIITGSTGGIGKEFVNNLANKGMSLLIISRTKSRLEEQKQELEEKFPNIEVHYAVFDFTQSGKQRDEFIKHLDTQLKKLDADGGIGMLINNVGTTNEIPMNLDEFDNKLVDDMVNCNIQGTVYMTRVVYPYMKARNNGCIVSISSGSGNHATPMLALYGASKAYITQFSRSMAVECWGTGVDFHVVTPYYIGGTNLYKRAKGTLIAPMPDALVEGTLAQLGKKYTFQGHGYWFHGLLGNIASYYWGSLDRWKKAMTGNRQRYDERQAAKAAENKSE